LSKKDAAPKGQPGNAEFGPLLRIATAELDRLTLDYGRRFDSVQGKASLLVTGAAVVAGLAANRGPVVVVSVVGPAVAAMILGVLAMWPTVQRGLDGTGVRNLLLPAKPPLPSESMALLSLYDYRNKALIGAEKRLRRMGQLLRAGFIALAVSVLPLIVESATFLVRG